jgi:anaerobic selenocysteine-containing dehydrogenase
VTTAALTWSTGHEAVRSRVVTTPKPNCPSMPVDRSPAGLVSDDRNGRNAMSVVYGSCNLCEAICGLEFTVENKTVVSIRGDEKDPLSRGHICPKALSLIDLHADTDRLTTPVKRVGEKWEKIGWDEAYDLVVDGLVSTRKKYGSNAVGLYQGNPNVHSMGAMTHGIPFTSLLRTRNRYSATSLDQLPHQLVDHLLYGHQLLLPIPDIDRTDFFLVLGGNPMASNGSMMTVPDFAKRARALRKRGGRLVVVDPRKTETADIADTHFFVRPGSDALLLLAMIHTIVADGSVRVADYVDGRIHADGGGTDRRHVGRRHLLSRTGLRCGGVCSGVRQDGGVDAAVRHGVPVGDPGTQHHHGQSRPPGRCDGDRSGDRSDLAGHRRPRTFRQVAQPRSRSP